MSNEPEQQPIIFLVEADDETRPLLKSNLQRYGHHVIVALDEEDALERARGGIHADLILVDVISMSPEEALNIGRQLRNYTKHNGHTPLVVMAEKYGADVEGTNVNVGGNDWITYLEEPGQLKNLLASLLRELSNQDTGETRRL